MHLTKIKKIFQKFKSQASKKNKANFSTNKDLKSQVTKRLVRGLLNHVDNDLVLDLTTCQVESIIPKMLSKWSKKNRYICTIIWNDETRNWYASNEFYGFEETW